MDGHNCTPKHLYDHLRYVSHEEQKAKARVSIEREIDLLADETGLPTDVLASRLIAGAKDIQSLDTTLVSARIQREAVGREIDTLARKVDDLQSTPEDEKRLLELVQQYQLSRAADISEGSAAGRHLQLRQITNLEGEAARYKALLAKQGASVQDLAKAIRMAGDATKIGKLLTAIEKGGLAWRYNAMLSNPITHVKNVSGNFIQTFAMPANRIIGGTLSGQFDTAGRDAIHTLIGLQRVFGDSLQMAKQAFDGGPQLSGASRTLDAASHPELFDDQALAQMLQDPDSVVEKGWGYWLKTAVTWPTKLLGVEDEFFLQLNYRARIYSDAMREGLDAGLKPGSVELENLVKQRLETGFNAQGRATNQSALAYAQKSTFSTPLSDDTFIRATGNLLNKAAESDNPALRMATNLFFPFRKTPANIIQEAMEYTGLSAPTIVKNIRAGGEQRAEAIGKLAVGWSVIGSVVTASRMGLITDGGPADPRARKQLELTGWKPYSIKVGNKYVSIEGMEPFASVIKVGAKLGQVLESGSEGEISEALHHSLIGLTESFGTKSYLKGMLDLGALISGQLDETAANRVISNIINSYIPSGIQLLKFDESMRRADGVLEKIYNRIPGLSKTLPPQFNYFGEPIQAPGHLGFTRAADDTPETQEIQRLINQGASFDQIPTKRGQVDLRQFKSAQGQDGYDRWGELVSTLKMSGVDRNGKEQAMTLREALRDNIENPAYKQLQEPFHGGEGDYEGGKAKQLKKIVTAYRLAAEQQMRSEGFKNGTGQSLNEAYERDSYMSRSGEPAPTEQAQPVSDNPFNLDFDSLNPSAQGENELLQPTN